MNRLFSILFLSLCVASPVAAFPQGGDQAADANATPVTPLSDAEVTELTAMLKAGEFQAVIKRLEKHPAVAARKRPADILYGLALSFAGRNKEAFNQCARYRQATERDLLALKLVGYALIGNDDPGSARSFFKLAKGYYPDDVEIGFNLARCDALLKLDEASLAPVTAFESRASELPKGLYESVVTGLLMRIAVRRIADGHSDEAAISLLEKAAAAAPKDVTPQDLLANLLVEKGDYAKAEAVIAEMERQFDSDLERVFFLRARILEKKGELEPALAMGKDAVQLGKWKHVPSMLLVARISLQLGRYDEARRPLDEVINVAPDDYEARFLRGGYLVHRVKEATEAGPRQDLLKLAEIDAQQAVRQRGFELAALELLATVYELWGNPKRDELGGVRKSIELVKKMNAQKADPAVPPPGGGK